MPKRLFILSGLLLYSTFFFGQSKQPNIAFDTNYFNAVDHWVVLPKGETDRFYLLGYLYLDAFEGFTFVFETTLTINPEDRWKTFTSLKNFIFKTALDKKTPLVAILSSDKIKELQLPEKPLWLKLYDFDLSATLLVRKGSQYNAVGKSDLALPFLEKAYRQDSKTKNGVFELALAYNSTQRYQQAISILREALQNDVADYRLYRELGFSLLQIQKTDDAEKVYQQGIENCPDESQKREMAVDMVETFYRLKDAAKFEKWKAILKNFIK
jgi:tetratricopeptide (TPR) repeat protein